MEDIKIKCAKRNCKWEGMEFELERCLDIEKSDLRGVDVYTGRCPVCGDNTFYEIKSK